MDDGQQRRFLFTTKSLLTLTLQVAISMIVWSGFEFMSVFAIPLAVLAIAGFVTNWRCWRGAALGALPTGVVILVLILASRTASSPSSFPRAVMGSIVMAIFGGAIGASIHTYILRWRVLGVVMAIASLLALQVAWMIPARTHNQVAPGKFKVGP